MRTRGTREGVAGTRAGENRRARALLRVVQVASSVGYVLALAATALGRPGLGAAVLLLVIVAKGILFARHLRVVPFTAVEHARLWLAQPLLHVAYSVRLAAGLWR